MILCLPWFKKFHLTHPRYAPLHSHYPPHILRLKIQIKHLNNKILWIKQTKLNKFPSNQKNLIFGVEERLRLFPNNLNFSGVEVFIGLGSVKWCGMEATSWRWWLRGSDDVEVATMRRFEWEMRDLGILRFEYLDQIKLKDLMGIEVFLKLKREGEPMPLPDPVFLE